MRVLVTGGSGFLGTHLVERLLADGHRVLTIDHVASDPGGSPQNERLTRVTGAIDDAEVVDSAFAGFEPDVVAHLAAAYRGHDAWALHVRANVIGTTRILRAAVNNGVERFINFQTGLSYGASPSEQPVTLDHPRDADSSYTITKTAAERYVEISGLDYVSFRLATVYGPRMAGGPLVIFFKRLSEGLPCTVVDARRDFTYVDDVIDLVMMAVNGTGHGAYNVGSGRDRPIRELFETVAAAMGVEPGDDVELLPLPKGAPRTLLLDPSRTTEDFGWRPTTPLEEGVARAVRWYRENGVMDEPFTHLREKS